MKNPWKGLLLACVVALLVSSPAVATAATITFGNVPVDLLQNAGAQNEAGFTYQAFGAGWELETNFSNPGAALATFFNGQGTTLGQRVDITRSGGGLFTFDAVDWRTVLDANSDDVVITGFLGGVAQGTLALTGSTTAFQTAAFGFSGPIDLLRVQVSLVSGNNALILDNFVVDAANVPVPEPTSMLLLGSGLLGAGVRRWRQRRA